MKEANFIIFTLLMKTPVLYRFVLVCLVVALPLLGRAGIRKSISSSGGEEFSVLDSTNRRPVQKPEDQKPEVDRPDVIKEVPRSRRLPKPKAVVDRVRMRRPPIMRPGVIRKRLGFH